MVVSSVEKKSPCEKKSYALARNDWQTWGLSFGGLRQHILLCQWRNCETTASTGANYFIWKVHCGRWEFDAVYWYGGELTVVDSRAFFHSRHEIVGFGQCWYHYGEDWLENYSPMWIHFRHKKMRFMHQGKRILLKGLKPEATVCRPIHCTKLKGLLRRNNVTRYNCKRFHSHSLTGIKLLIMLSLVFNTVCLHPSNRLYISFLRCSKIQQLYHPNEPVITPLSWCRVPNQLTQEPTDCPKIRKMKWKSSWKTCYWKVTLVWARAHSHL